MSGTLVSNNTVNRQQLAKPAPNDFKGGGQEMQPIGKEAIKSIPKEDVLLKYPTRGLAYSNEVGEALRPLGDTLATVMWAPALMYIGADIYDKYSKGEDGTGEKPSAKCGLKAAIFQTLASVFMPTGAVVLGQKTANLITSKSSNLKLGAADKLVILEALHPLEKHNLLEKIKHTLDDKEGLEKAVKAIADEATQKGKHPFKAMGKIVNGGKFSKGRLKEVTEYIIESTKSVKGMTDEKAIGEIIAKMQKKPRAIKVAAGFIGLALAVKPIDHFVEKVVIGKLVEPMLFGKKPTESKPHNA